MILIWKREITLIAIIAAAIILGTGLIIGVVKLTGTVRLSTGEKRNELLREQPIQTPLPNLPLVTYVEGFPEGKSKQSDTWELLDTGVELNRDSVIRTDETSFLDIRIQPGSVLRVMENTTLSLASLYEQKIELNVTKGTILAQIKRLLGSQSFDFQSPSVVAGIRGTELIVSAAPEGTTIFGMSGKIEVYNPNFPNHKVIVGLHEKSFVQVGAEPTEVVAMSTEEMEKYRNLLDSLRDNPVFIVSDNITFQPDSTQLTPEALIAIEAIYEQLLTVQGKIKIIGHTADIGSPESQIEISTRRARAVMDYLVTLGLPVSRLTSIGLGSTQPVSYNDDTMGKNRRVEFVIE